MDFSFKIDKELSGFLGRTGVISTAHGHIKTPAFVAVGTQGTVKSLTPEMIEGCGVQVVLSNTYHLYLEPGDKLVNQSGGLHKFMNWSGPTMTDSGGFQVFSLGAGYGKNIGKISNPNKELFLSASVEEVKLPIAHIDPNGVTFKSHRDGSTHYITPEKSIDIQHNLGADIIFAFDECTSPLESLHYQKEALERTHRWAKRSLEYHKKSENSEKQALFGIVQGGRDESLRKESSKVISEMNFEGKGFDGFGIGGSFEKEDMGNAVTWCNQILPKEKPRHLLGIGEPEDLFMAVQNGCDLFDCVVPTRLGRNGTIYTSSGKIHIENSDFRSDFKALDDDCKCYTCQNYTRAYIAHLFRAKEMLAGTLSSMHNLYFLTHLVDDMRSKIENDDFMAYKKDFLDKYKTK